MKSKHLLRSQNDIAAPPLYPIYISHPQSQFLQKVAKQQSRQLDHFVRSKLLSSQRSCPSSSKLACSHSLHLNLNSRSRSPQPVLTEQHSSPNLYQVMQQRQSQKLDLQRESLQSKERYKSLYIMQLEKSKRGHREESRKKRSDRVRHNMKNREFRDREKRKKSEDTARRIRAKQDKVRDFLQNKAQELKEAEKIRREISRKKQELGSKIRTLQEHGLDSCSILSILSTQSLISGQKGVRSSANLLSNRKTVRSKDKESSIMYQRNTEKIRESEYFTSNSKSPPKQDIYNSKTAHKPTRR